MDKKEWIIQVIIWYYSESIKVQKQSYLVGLLTCFHVCGYNDKDGDTTNDMMKSMYDTVYGDNRPFICIHRL